MNISRPHIKEDVKRRVRQEAGFGCVICGDMVLDAEHIVNFSEGGADTVENLAALCVRHHREVTSGRMAKKVVESGKKSPWCLKERNQANYRFNLLDHAFIPIGGSLFQLNEEGLVVFRSGDTNVFSVRVEGGIPFFSMNFSGPTGEQSLLIKDNVVSVNNKNVWDAKLVGTHLSVHYGDRIPFLDIEISQSRINIRRAVFVEEYGSIIAKKGNIYTHAMMSDGTLGVNTWTECLFYNYEARVPDAPIVYYAGEEQANAMFIFSTTRLDRRLSFEKVFNRTTLKRAGFYKDT